MRREPQRSPEPVKLTGARQPATQQTRVAGSALAAVPRLSSLEPTGRLQGRRRLSQQGDSPCVSEGESDTEMSHTRTVRVSIHSSLQDNETEENSNASTQASAEASIGMGSSHVRLGIRHGAG
jgi:hypothetical protein